MSANNGCLDDSIDSLVSDRKAFNKFVYTSYKDALLESHRRQSKPIKIAGLMVPKPLKKRRPLVIFRHMATTNYEIMRFMGIAQAADADPLILEYTSDLFLSLNKWKYSLAKLIFYKGRGRGGNLKIERKSIIDFNICNRKPFSKIKTLWGQDLVDFHHELFLKRFPKYKESVFDLSDWLKCNGSCSTGYYKKFLSLFLNNAILFENFLLEGEELQFTKKVVLPALQEIFHETGHKPLIVPLEPTKTEDNLFWLCHPLEEKQLIKEKERLAKQKLLI